MLFGCFTMEGLNKMPILLVLLVGLPFLVSAAPGGRIFGGIDAKPGQLPYMVSLQLYGGHYCGGSILTKRTILTAAHCLDESPREYSVFVGSTALNGSGTIYNVSDYKLHPFWNPRGATFDTGVVYLDKDIVYSSLIQPIALNSEFIDEGKLVEISGWGATENTSQPNNLQYLTIKTVTNEYCQGFMNAVNISVHYSNVCAESPMGMGTCFGDSGSPLVLDGKQVGITSWGIPCASHFPDAFSRVSSSYDWLKSVIQ